MPKGVKIIRYGHLDGLKAGRVYTVRAIGRRHPEDPMLPAVWLQEIKRPIQTPLSRRYGEPGFAFARFRPLESKPTEISIFTAMLNPAPAQPELVS